MSKLYVATAFPHGVYSTELPESGTAVWEAMFLDDISGDVGPKYYAVIRENDIAAFKQDLQYAGSVLPDDLCAAAIGFTEMINYISQNYPDMYGEYVDLYEEVQNLSKFNKVEDKRLEAELTEYLSRYVDKEQLTGCVTVRPDFMDVQEEEI